MIPRILINTSKDYYRHEIRYAQMPEEEAAYDGGRDNGGGAGRSV